MNEHDLTRKVNEFFRRRQSAGSKFWYLKTGGGMFQRVGVPDYLLCVNGRFIAIELKHPETRPAPNAHQARELRAIEHAGGQSYALYSFEEVKGILDAALESDTG